MIVLTAVFFAALAAIDGPLPYSIIEKPNTVTNLGSLHVRVLDRNRNPVSGAEVTCGFVSGLFSVEESAPKTTRTSADGRCVFKGLKPSQVEVYCKQGPSGALKQFTVGVPASPPEVELVLGAYHEIRGRLIGPDGEPIAGARPFVDNAIECPPTDAFGNFSVQHLVNDSAELTFFKEGFATTTQDMNFCRRLILTMPRGVRLRVCVDGAPAVAASDIKIECRSPRRTSVAPAWTGGPLSGPVWIPSNESTNVSIRCKHGGTWYSGNGTANAHSEDLEVTVKLEPSFVLKSEEGPIPNGSFIRTYVPVEWKGPGSISGRVLIDASRRPVAATVACQLAKNYSVYTRTKRDGSFTFTGLPDNDVIVSVNADDATLYDPSATKTYDLAAAGQVEKVEFALKPGVAISGKVINLESPTSHAFVLLRPEVRGYAKPLFSAPGGAFTFRNLPPGNEYTLALRLHDETAEYGRISLGVLEPGTHKTDAQLDRQSTLPSNVQGVIRGVALDSAGVPISGLLIYTKGVEKKSFAGTNLDGTFALRYFQTGEIALGALDQTLILMQHDSVSNDIEREILADKPLNLSERGMHEPVQFVIGDTGPSPLVAGQVVTESGENVADYQIDCISPSGQRSDSSGNGQFAIGHLPEYEKVAIEFRAPGYQAKVLLEGRDFSRGDMYMKVVLKPLPYSQTPSVFEQVTGVPVGMISDYPVLSRHKSRYLSGPQILK